MGNSKHFSSGLRLTGMESRPIIEEKELTQEEIERDEQLARDLVSMVPLPSHLFELRGEPVIKPEANKDLISAYLADLEAYQNMQQLREEGKAVDEAEF